jgi:hypothetical protein
MHNHTPSTPHINTQALCAALQGAALRDGNDSMEEEETDDEADEEGKDDVVGYINANAGAW